MTDARKLLKEWMEEYGGSTFPGAKPCTPDLERRTKEYLTSPAPECICPKCGIRHGGSNVQDPGF